ncbi:MAG: amidohydrolase family protein [Chloroflexi bacterium]|nr:amidohydrolase family protein [Chloroflexota bacterium]
MIIDAHNHPDWHGHGLRQFLENMSAYDIDKTWLLSWEAPTDEYDPEYNRIMLTGPGGPIPFDRCLRYVEQAPNRFVLGFAPDPRAPDAIDRLEAAIEVCGVRVCGELKLRMMYDNPDALRMFRFCGERGLPVIVHIDYEFDTGRRYPRPNWWYGGGIAALERALAACPDTHFIGHAPGFWAHISGDGAFEQEEYPSGRVTPGGVVVRLLRQYPNLHADLSAGSAFNALTRDPEFGRDFVLEFHSRLLFGRDSFDNKMQQLLSRMELAVEVLDQVMAGNAMRLIGDNDGLAGPCAG